MRVLRVLGWASAATLGVAIAVPLISTYQHDSNRRRQKRTMSDLRAVGTALQAFQLEEGRFPAATSGTVDRIFPRISPEYIRDAPPVDGWGRPFRYESNGESFELGSAGRDGLWEVDPPGGKRQGFDSDLIYEDGGFIQWPEGI